MGRNVRKVMRRHFPTKFEFGSSSSNKVGALDVVILRVGALESQFFFVTSLGISAVFGCGLYFWHRSESSL